MPHTAESIKDPKTTQVERDAWDAYLGELEQYDTLIAQRDLQVQSARTRAIIDEGMTIRNSPSIDAMREWAQRRMDRYGILIPLEPEEDLVMAWISGNVIKTSQDAYRLVVGIAAASGLDKETLDKIEDMFRSTMGRG